MYIFKTLITKILINLVTVFHNKGKIKISLKTSLINFKDKKESDNFTVLKPSKKQEVKAKFKKQPKIKSTI